MRKKPKLYKKKYLIVFYNENDEVVQIFDNTQEFSEYIDLKFETASKILSKLFRKIYTYYFLDQQKCKVHFIDYYKK